VKSVIGLLSVLCLLACASVTNLHAQGFDWQYNARFPSTSPIRFIGAEIASGYTMHNGSLPYLAKDLGFTCCTYENGTGIPLALGITGDYWVAGDWALTGSLGYRAHNASFSAKSDPLPLADGRIFQTEYVYASTLHYAAASVGARYRLLGTHVTIGGGVRGMVLLGTSATHTERILSPDDRYFNGNPPSKEIVHDTRGLPDAQRLMVVPYVQLGYDISISRGVYLSPTLTLGLPLMSVSSDATWRMTDVGIGVRLLRGF